MAKFSFPFILLLSLQTLTLLPINYASFAKPISKTELGIKALDDKQTQLTFYFHNTLSGPNPSSLQIAQAKSTDQSSTMFGALAMVDNPLTEGPEITSKLVGRAQGMQASVGQTESTLMMVMNFYFLEGEYKGGTLSVLGRDIMGEGVGEVPVVGGTGAFRFAKGYAQIKSQTLDQKSGDSMMQFNVVVNHASSIGSGTQLSDGAPSPTQVFTCLVMISLLYLFIF